MQPHCTLTNSPMLSASAAVSLRSGDLDLSQFVSSVLPFCTFPILLVNLMQLDLCDDVLRFFGGQVCLPAIFPTGLGLFPLPLNHTFTRPK